MSIEKITTTLTQLQVLEKINEVVDAINNYATSTPYVTNATVSGTTLTVTFSDGSTANRSLQDTTYSVATTTSNGLMSSTMVGSLNTLSTDMTSLATRVAALEPSGNGE